MPTLDVPVTGLPPMRAHAKDHSWVRKRSQKINSRIDMEDGSLVLLSEFHIRKSYVTLSVAQFPVYNDSFFFEQ